MKAIKTMESNTYVSLTWVIYKLASPITSAYSKASRALLCLSLIMTGFLPVATAPLYADNKNTTLVTQIGGNPIQPSPQSSLYFVLFLNNENSEFWQLTEKAAKAAAKDLGIELQVISLENNPLRPVRAVSALVNAAKKPDAVLFSNLKNTGKSVLKVLEEHRIYSLIFDNGFAASDQIGLPGSEYRFWQAELLGNNVYASRMLTLDLINKAHLQFGVFEKLPMIALAGSPSSEVNAERMLGMYDTLKKYKDSVEIRQVFNTNWNQKHARNAVLASYRRYPGVRIIWAASDAMALSAADALLEIGKKPGEDVFIAGFDRLPRIQQRIDQGQIVNSYGGHYMSAAWGIVYMYDFFNGFNLAHRSMQLPLFDHKAVGIPYEQEIRKGRFDQIDFKLFSKTLAPGNRSYLFLNNSDQHQKTQELSKR